MTNQREPGLPRLRVERAVKQAFDLDDADVWATAREIAPFRLADGSAPASQQTLVHVCFDDDALYVRFDCDDREIWGTYSERDEPLYEQEVVEVMIAAGADDPIDYFEFEVSPNGVLFDTTVHNPTATRADLNWDATWNCPGIRWLAQRDDMHARWWATLVIPWRGISPLAEIPRTCRANFYRIERPHNREPEFSCWSPTMMNPADFHKPAYFGILEFDRRSNP